MSIKVSPIHLHFHLRHISRKPMGGFLLEPFQRGDRPYSAESDPNNQMNRKELAETFIKISK